MAIQFYSTKEKYGEFSNFTRFPFTVDGKEWLTSEHYFQAQKFENEEYRERIRTTVSPMVAARLGRSRKVPIRADWETIKVEVMKDAVRSKVKSHPSLTKLLLDTGDEVIIEAAPNDYFWGCGKSGEGQNWLGRILMEIRQEIRDKN